MFSSGTKSKLSPECGLARGNPHQPGVIGLVSKPKLSQSNFLADLKAQFTLHLRGYDEIFDFRHNIHPKFG
jgi:hypothetical protein